MSGSTLSLSSLNLGSADSFVSALSGVYESSPWVPQQVVAARPFASVEALREAMKQVVERAPKHQQLQLIKSHPRLALKNEEPLTASSQYEQETAGLLKLSSDAHAQLKKWSERYEKTHGFPFIISVMHVDRDTIIRSLGERVFNDTAYEQQRAIAEIHKIAQARLSRLFPGQVTFTALPLGTTRPSVGTSITDCQYGKSRVRVARVIKDSPVQRVKEVEVQCLMRGDLNASFTRGDNTIVVPTDTVKNTVTVLARNGLTKSIEDFGITIGSHFLSTYAHVSSVDIRITEKIWERQLVETPATVDNFNGPSTPHNHVFKLKSPEKPWTHVVAQRSGIWLESGIADLTVMKTTASGFTDFPRADGLTTLSDTEDRILATKIAAVWQWSRVPSNGFDKANQHLLHWMFNRFATRYSVSVQATEYEMCLEALAAVPEIRNIKITLPNVHFIPFNMTPFKLPNENTVFVPTDEPHGTIEIEVERQGENNNKQFSANEVRLLGSMAGTKPTTAVAPKPKL